MNTALTLSFAFAVALPAIFSPQQKASEAQTAIDTLRAEMKIPAARLTALEDSDKKLTLSNQAQIDTTAMLNRTERRILQDDEPKVKMRRAAFEVRKRNYIDSGCPWEGATLPKPVVERCEGLRGPLNTELIETVKDEKRVQDQKDTIAKTRQSITETTLANAKQQKANFALRDELEALRRLQEAQLRKLYMAGITEAVRKTDLKEKASAACKSIANLEESVCCHEVVWDDKKPALCDVPLIYSLFEKAGIFSSNVVR